MYRLFNALVLLLLSATISFAWSAKEHVQLTRIAGTHLLNDPTTPPEMKKWLTQILGQTMDLSGEKAFFMTARLGAMPRGLSGVLAFAVEPDIRANADRDTKIEPYGEPERLLHYIDLEYFISGDAKRVYKPDLSSKPQIENIPHDLKDPRFLQAGFLPFRVEESYQNLVKAIKENHLSETPDNDNAVRWAGYLAHYLEDNTQPQHATVDYKSSEYFAGPLKKRPNVHAEVEYKMIDDENNDFMALRQEFWPLFENQLLVFKDPIQTNDLFQATLQISLKSYDALPLIGLAAMKATQSRGTPEVPSRDFQPLDTEVFFRFKGPYGGATASVMGMKAQQLAWAVARVQRVWKQAWLEAHAPDASKSNP